MAAAEKEVSKAERDFCKDFMSQQGDRLKYCAWVNKENRRGTIQPRLLLIGAFYVVSLKSTMTGKTLRRKGHYYDLSRLACNEPQQLDLIFKDFHILFRATPVNCECIVRTILQAYAEVTVSFPDEIKVRLDPWEDGEPPIMPRVESTWDNFVEIMSAHSLLLDQPIAEGLINSIDVGKAFDHILNLTTYKGLKITNKASTVSLKPVVRALQYNTWFEHVDLSNTFRPDAVIAFATALRKNSTIHTLCLSSVGAASGFTEFAQAIRFNPNVALTSLDLSGNLLKDKGLIEISDGLSRLPLSILNLSQCEFRTGGLNALMTAFTTSTTINFRLKELDLSYNEFGGTGSGQLAKWMTDCAPQLTVLNLAYTKCDVSVLGEGVAAVTSLETLDIAGSKIVTKAANTLNVALKDNVRLHDLILKESEVPPNALSTLLEGLMSNPQRERYGASFVVDGINFGGATATSILTRAMKVGPILTRLSINDAKLTAKGTGVVFDSIAKDAPHLVFLSIQNNIPTSEAQGKNKSDDVDAAVAKLCVMVGKVPVETLLLRGSPGFSIGPSLAPLISALPSTTSLATLDIAFNEIGDNAAHELREVFCSNQSSLTSLDFDGSALSLDGMRAISEALVGNDTLRDFVWPEEDLRDIYKNITKSYKKKESVRYKEELVEIKNRIRSVLHSQTARRPANKISHAVFGVELDTTMSRYDATRDIPVVMERCIDYIYSRGLTQEGIFRVPANADHVNQLRNQFDEDEYFAFEDDPDLREVHCVAAALKLYLRELPEPLIPFEQYGAFIAAAKETDEDARNAIIYNLVGDLPQHSYLALKAITSLLVSVAQNEEVNKMGVPNLTLVFQPNILRPEVETVANLMDMNFSSLVIQLLLEYWDFFFEADLDDDYGGDGGGGVGGAGGAYDYSEEEG